MIISRTPFRISFFGGGTDYPIWYEENGGEVLAATIDKYCYVTSRFLPPFFDYKYRIRYTHREETKTIKEIAHPSVRECLDFIGLDQGVEIQHNADLPAMSGLGSSSAFTVGLLNSLYALSGKMATKRQLALNAIYIEQERIKENVGSQDQTLSAFGGLNHVIFGGERKILVQHVPLNREKMAFFQSHFMLFFSGFSRMASEIASEQIRKTPEKGKELIRMREMVEEGLSIITGEPSAYEDFGRLLNESWRVKRSLTSMISTQQIDEIYEAALKAGALGGKLLGAGGGGFMLFFVRPEQQSKVKEALKGLLHVPFNFENLGSQIIYYAPNDNF
ncbi:MAG: kinase [Candidatus Margulisiibacteriota bacterium]